MADRKAINTAISDAVELIDNATTLVDPDAEPELYADLARLENEMFRFKDRWHLWKVV